jgi:hypothetical protein
MWELLRILGTGVVGKMNMGICYVSLPSCTAKCKRFLTPAVHLTDLGSMAAPDNERQAPYSSVGQVRMPSSLLKAESNKLVRLSSRSTRTRVASSVCTLLKKPPMEAKARLPLLGISTISFEGSGQI